MIPPRRITADPIDILTHFALGDYVCYEDEEGSPVRWMTRPHRGVHLLKEVAVPKSQRRYVFSDKFDIRVDTAYDEVVRACADLSRTGHTWILPELVEGYCRLFRMGFAHSFEAWQDGKLVGGCFGVHIGAYMSIESMFYRVSHASKAAYGHALLKLKERGFVLVDSNPVKDESRNYGEEWIPHWMFEGLLRRAIEMKVTLSDDRPCPPLPAKVRAALPVARVIRKVARRFIKS